MKAKPFVLQFILDMFAYDSPVWSFVLLVLVLVGLAYPAHASAAGSLVVCILVGRGLFWAIQLAGDGDSYEYDDDGSAPLAVDVWDMQRQLMTISDQKMPSSPMMTTEATLYGALIMEESSEMFMGIAKSLRRYFGGEIHIARQEHPMMIVARSFYNRAQDLKVTSVTIRERIAGVGRFAYDMTDAEAVEILDGTTDIAVVNAGFALAAGLPGAEAYEEVSRSNFSKANPNTGLIDKDPGGKWIKGRDYTKPNLAAVLASHANQ